MAQLHKITALVQADSEDEAVREAAQAVGESVRKGMETKVFAGPAAKVKDTVHRVGTVIGSYALAADPGEPDKNFRFEFTKKG